MARSQFFPYTAILGWRTLDQNWSNMLADIVDQFGLPGQRYITSLTDDLMHFHFKLEQDLLLFKLKWSEYEL